MGTGEWETLLGDISLARAPSSLHTHPSRSFFHLYMHSRLPAVPLHTFLTALRTPQPSSAPPPQYPRVSLRSTPFLQEKGPGNLALIFHKLPSKM